MLISEEKLSLKEFPRLLCPTCKDGQLYIVKETIKDEHPSFIKQLPDDPSEVEQYTDETGKLHWPATKLHIEETVYEVFISSFYLECDREQCKETVVTCGETKMEEYYDIDHIGMPYLVKSYYYFPKFFHPAIRLFNFPSKTPEPIKSELLKAFSLFWAHPSACANSLRKAVERILDALEGKSKKKLHARINEMNSVNAELKDLLMATKWIGNDGSHDEIDLEHSDVIIAFEFIEKCLFELYKNEGKDLNFIASEINKAEKPISKKGEKE
ncbi:MAG: DUF4145 domain-containing protein [Saprospiraceae bacterium]